MKGVDERVAKYIADEEISIGDFVLSGDELPALIVTEAVSRHLPSVLGKTESLEERMALSPTYTRPPVLKKWFIFKILLSGDHKKIDRWRRMVNSKHENPKSKYRFHQYSRQSRGKFKAPNFKYRNPCFEHWILGFGICSLFRYSDLEFQTRFDILLILLTY